MALGPLTLDVTYGVAGRAFQATISGQSTGSTVEVVGYDGTPGFSTSNGRVYYSQLPAQNPVTLVLRETLAGTGTRDSRISIAVDGIPLGAAGLPSALPSALTGAGYGTAQATRIVRAAQKGVPALATVMASPPTITQGTQNAASTIPNSGGSTVFAPLGSETYRANSAAVKALGGPIATQGAGYRIQTRTNGLVAGTRTGSNGCGIATVTPAPQVGIVLNIPSGQLGWVMMVTDLITGAQSRARVASSDQALSATGAYEIAFQFGDGTDSAANVRPRLLEFYTANGAAVLYGFNVDTTKYQCQYPNANPDEPKIALVWDSWGEAITNPVTNPARLGQPAFFMAALGATNGFSCSLGSTGMLATNSGAAMNFLQRLQNGDLNASRVGVMDLVSTYVSTNDVATANGFTPAQAQAQVPLVLAAIRAAQPSAIIHLTGPQYTTSSPAAQSWYDAAQAGWAAYVASSGDANCLYTDNSPAGQNWLSAQSNTIFFTGTSAHPNDIGAQNWATQHANAIIGAVKAKYGL